MGFSHFDIHSHLNDSRYVSDLEEVIDRMAKARVGTIVVGTDHAMSDRAIRIAEANPERTWATIGLHPTDNSEEAFDTIAYERMAEHPRVVAIGECGLDYYWPAHEGWKNGESVEKARQRELFERQIALARSSGKPLMIHGRPTKGTMDAYEDILDVLEHSGDTRGNVHFFVGDVGIARRFLDLGFTMSFTAVVTFARDYDEVIRFLPLDRIMSETDAPYVAPKAYRGSRNEPSWVSETVAGIAEVRGEDPARVASAMVENAIRGFRLA